MLQTLLFTGDDITADQYSKIYTIARDAMEVVVDRISIYNDSVPETNETFALFLENDDSAYGDTLNVFPLNVVVTMTIVDDDGMYYAQL